MNQCILIICLIFSAFASAERAPEISSITARQLDSTLPDQPLDQWLISALSSKWVVSVYPELTDCGEYSGNPEQVDYPLCIEVVLKNDESEGYLYIFVGTNIKGISGEPKFFWGVVNNHSINKLSSLVGAVDF